MPRFVVGLAIVSSVAILVLANRSHGEGAGADIDPKTLYKLDTSGTTTSLKAGSAGKLVMNVVPSSGAHVKSDTPFRGTLAATGPVTLSTTKLSKASSYANNGATVEVPFQATAAGSSQISADLTFFVCTEEACMRTSEKVQVPVSVQP